MHSLLIKYSSDPKISFNKLKSWSDWDFVLQSKVNKLLEDTPIKWILSEDELFHLKLSFIKPRLDLLYYIWDISLLDRQILSIVWPRKNTQYANKVLQKLFDNLNSYDIATISWLADWVDQLCHTYSIQKSIPTIAVLGTWIWRYLQSSNRDWIKKIVNSWWLILSEYKFFAWPAKYTFPHRNRIIAWLCDVLFLPEAWEDSGSLITVDFANKMHKPVYWVPNDIFSDSSKWINQYISQKKIQLVSDFWFLSKHFSSTSQLPIPNTSNWLPSGKFPNISLSQDQKKILTLISYIWEIWLDKLCSISSIPFQELFWLLTILEINNLVYQSSPGIYKLI